MKEKGLWAPHLPEEYGGMGIGFLKHAYMNEILAWSPFSNPIFGVMAPNSGNQKILVKYGTDRAEEEVARAPRRRHDAVLLRHDRAGPARLRSPLDPDPAVRDGDEWVINGHKWYSSNAKRRRLRHRHVSHRDGRARATSTTR